MHQKSGFSRIEDYSVLTDFVDRMIRIADELVDQIKTGQLDGEFHFHRDSVNSSAAGESVSLTLLCEMLCERPEIAGVDLCDDEVCVTVAPDYAVYENNTTYHVLNQEQVDVICALHTLWLHGAGGEQADFSGCLLRGINLSGRNLSRAVFAGTKLVDCMMYDTRLNTSNFDGSRLQNCQLINAQAERCSFRNAFIALTDMDTVSTRFSNFTGATISKYSVPKDEPFAFANESQDLSLTM